jgi:geranylgeranyl diphosphate synthase type I
MAATLEAVGAHPYVDRVEGRLRSLLEAERDCWSALDPRFAPALETLLDLGLCGGKRLRALFAYWAFVGAGGDPESDVIRDAGAALELIQLAALIHDDVMDGAQLRRGRPSAHVRLGEGRAIVLGDLALFYADTLIADLPGTARRLLAELRVEMALGQFLELTATAAGPPTTRTAELIALFKAGKYTVERPLHIGAALAGRLSELGGVLTAYGLRVGMAFQLRDDLLDAIDDRSQGKPTLLAAVGGSRSDVEGCIEVLVAQAVEAVACSALEATARSALLDLARFVVERRG